MYLVVTEWRPKPGQREEFRKRGLAVGSKMRKLGGVELLEVFESGDRVMVVHGYTDEATYKRLIQDPNGEFARMHAAAGVEDYGDWVSSVGGETEPH